MNFTKKQLEILNIIQTNKNMTLKDIALKLGVDSTGAIHDRLKRLINKGALIKDGKKYTVISDNISTPDLVYLPFYGYAQGGNNDLYNLGKPLGEKAFTSESLPNKPEKLFVIEAKGNSMEPQIKEGDILICEWVNDNNVNSGNIVIATTKDNGIKIKKIDFFKRLLLSTNSDNDKNSNIPFEDISTINGKVVQIISKLA